MISYETVLLQLRCCCEYSQCFSNKIYNTVAVILSHNWWHQAKRILKCIVTLSRKRALKLTSFFTTRGHYAAHCIYYFVCVFILQWTHAMMESFVLFHTLYKFSFSIIFTLNTIITNLHYINFNEMIVVIKSLIGQFWKYVPHRRVFVWGNEISSFDKYYASSDMHS